MEQKRYLTKSRFALAVQCPTKLYYTGKRDIYENTSADDPFLETLADGGYQVGELAKYYYPDGHDIKSLDYEQSLAETARYIESQDAIIYEAAVRHNNFFIRVDILYKYGNTIELIEVKSKSIDPGNEKSMLNTRGFIDGGWSPYLYDVAFQKHVMQLAYPGYDIKAYLLVVNKNGISSVDGLNQRFIIKKDPKGRKYIEVSDDSGLTEAAQEVLTKISVDHHCDLIYNNKHVPDPTAKSLAEITEYWAECYKKDEKIQSDISSACKSCEFRTLPGSELKSGYQECWSEQLGWHDRDFDDPTIQDIWKLHHATHRKLLDSKKYKMSQLDQDDLNVSPDNKPGLSSSERRWLQVEKVKNKDDSIYFDREGFLSEAQRWNFPLHFIDFETIRAALPFNKGQKTNQVTLFQFSHHTVDADGTVSHAGQYLNTTRGSDPSYDCVRELKKQLEKDDGTIFRYADHENTVLHEVMLRLKEEESVGDRGELCDFIRSITHSTGKSDQSYTGDRDMVDLKDLVMRYYYDPKTQGSNSLKFILPSIIRHSKYIQKKYSTPIYGVDGEIFSCNFEDKTWVVENSGQIEDPYALLEKMFTDLNEHDDLLMQEYDEIKHGGAAMVAYAKTQFEEMKQEEINRIQKALYQYCELDTLAMVMLYQGWNNEMSE